MLIRSHRHILGIAFWLAVTSAQTAGQTPSKPEPLSADGRVMLAEGKYGLLAEGKYFHFNSWTLWSTPAGLKVDIQFFLKADVAKGGRQQETLELAPNLTMRRFRYDAKKLFGLVDLVLECSREAERLECVSTSPEETGRGSMPFAGGYATQFGVEMALLDIPWFYATLLAESDRDARQPRELGIVTLAFDGKTPDERVTGNRSTADVKYLGTEGIRLMGRPVKGHKFQVTARHYSATAWTAESGLLLAVDWAGMRIELTQYKQSFDLVPELRDTEEPPATPVPPPAPAVPKTQ